MKKSGVSGLVSALKVFLFVLLIAGVAADFRCQLEQKIQQADIAIQKKQQELAALYASRSWRLTKPLRTLGGFARALFRR
ncbi:MAG: hypothetical protein IJ717_08200 [Treponema sp.]|nr:hypothetical protein [Treponema sp.]